MSKPIDFKPATHELDELMFKVELVKLSAVGEQQNLFSSIQERAIEVPGYFAVLNKDSVKVMSVVSSNYKLITNREALEWGKVAFNMLFPVVNVNDLIPYKVIAPKSMASCHIDLIHKGVRFDVWEQETWLPFLRISNSYNRTQTLSFELGFVRKLCSNGVLFNKKTVKVKYPHNKGQEITLNVDVEQLRPLEDKFKLSCSNLKTVYMDPTMMFALVCLVFGLNLEISEGRRERQVEVLERMKESVHRLTQLYFGSLGENAYAALSVLTDIISHQDQHRSISSFSLNPNSYYYRAADWVIDFAEKSSSHDFSFANYLADTVKQLNDINKKTKFEWKLEF